jgi:hypothetical protein
MRRSPEVHLTGPMPVDTLKLFWPKFLAGDARKWVMQNERWPSSWRQGGRFLTARRACLMQAGAELAPEAVNVELDLAGMTSPYREIAADPNRQRQDMSGITFWVDIPRQNCRALRSEIALSEGRSHPRPASRSAARSDHLQGGRHHGNRAPAVDHEPLGYMQAVG